MEDKWRWPSLDDKVRAIEHCLKVGFKDKELEQIESFLNRGFSTYGRTLIASLFLFAARDCQIPIEDVLEECEKEWERNWQYQPLEIRGSTDVLGDIGIQNADSLKNIHRALGISFSALLKKSNNKKI